MKLKNLKNRSLIKIHLLKNQIYKFNGLFQFEIDNTVLELKKVLNLIYVFNKKKKIIMFAGFPFKKSLHNQLNHFFITKNYYKKEMLLGSQKLKKKPDLIVINYTCDNDDNFIKEIKNFNLPLVVFGKKLNYLDKFYFIQGDFKTKKIKNLCFFLIFSILTKNNFKL